MQVFNVYFKIIKKNIPMLMIYIVVFVGLTMTFSASGQSTKITEFTESRASVAFTNNDTDSELVNGLVDYIGGKSKLVTLADNQEAIQDALFFRKAEYIIRIPAGFTENFMNGKSMKLSETSIPDSTSGIYMEMLINNYLTSASHYVKYIPGMTQAELVAQISQDLANKTNVVIPDAGNGVANGSSIASFFNFTFYPLTVILILGITSFMLVFNDPLRKQRTQCSPLSQSRISLESLLANLVFTVIVWAIMFGAGLVMIGKELITVNGLLWAVNLLIIAFVGLSMSFLVGNVIKNKNAQSAVANTLGLGLAFLSGCFVPQSLLNETVLTVARFLPTYWYVRASDEIGVLKSFSWESLQPIIFSYLIQLGFAAAIICVALVVTRQVRSGPARKA